MSTPGSPKMQSAPSPTVAPSTPLTTATPSIPSPTVTPSATTVQYEPNPLLFQNLNSGVTQRGSTLPWPTEILSTSNHADPRRASLRTSFQSTPAASFSFGLGNLRAGLNISIGGRSERSRFGNAPDFCDPEDNSSDSDDSLSGFDETPYGPFPHFSHTHPPFYHRRPTDPCRHPYPDYPDYFRPPVFPGPKLHSLLFQGTSIHFDLSHSGFLPQGATRDRVNHEVLLQPATTPPTKKLVIKSRLLHGPQIVLEYPPDAILHYSLRNLEAPPITVGDVLYAIHLIAQTQITDDDWNNTKGEKKGPVARAYWRRCELAHRRGDCVAAGGLKKVDYLKKKVMFAGLKQKGGEIRPNVLELKLVTREPDSQWGIIYSQPETNHGSCAGCTSV